MKSAGVIRYLSKSVTPYVEQSELGPTSSKVILISLSICVCGNEKSVLVSANIYVTIT